MQKKKISIFLFFCVCLFYFTACGLDTVSFLNPPKRTYHTITVSSDQTTHTDYGEAYFTFLTDDKGNKDAESDYVYEGTAIYYRIYNNASTLISKNSSISSILSGTNAASSATQIKSWGYQVLNSDKGTIFPLENDNSENKVIYVRLTNYGDSDDFKAEIKYVPESVYTADTTDWIDLGTPVRNFNISGNYSFDFGRHDKTKSDYDVPPNMDSSSDSCDTDCNYSSSWTDEDKNIYYVDLYAVSVGRDQSFSEFYSEVLHLGSVAIDASSEDN